MQDKTIGCFRGALEVHGQDESGIHRCGLLGNRDDGLVVEGVIGLEPGLYGAVGGREARDGGIQVVVHTLELEALACFAGDWIEHVGPAEGCPAGGVGIAVGHRGVSEIG